jgi:hypothetical protein
MATVHHQIEYWTATIPPGGAFWLSYGPDDRYENGTVQVMCTPSVQVGGGQHRTVTLSVPELFNTQVPTVSGDIVRIATYVGFNVTNRGTETIKYFSVALTIIGP